MLNSKTILTVSCAILLTGCSTFYGDKPEPPVEGERISVLELQNNLTADKPLSEGQKFRLPEAWSNTAWPQAGGYPNHSMQNLTLNNGSLKKLWHADIGRGTTDALPMTAQPVIAEGAIYTLDTNSRVSAFSTANGKLIWETSLKNKAEDEQVISGGISFSNNTLYITTGYDEIVALSPRNGSVKWKKRLPSPSRAAPTVLGGRAYVVTVDSRLVTLDAADGTSLWEYRGINEMTGLLGAGSPAANNEVVIAAFSSGEITALRVENGSVAWSDNLANVRQFGGGLQSMADIKAMPVIDQGIVIAISIGGKMAAIDENTGIRRWQRDIGGAHTPWVTGNHVYVLSHENQLISLSLIDGSIFWITQLDTYKNEKKREKLIKWTAPLMASDYIYVAGSHGYMLKIDPHNGEIKQKIKTGQNVQIQPVVAQSTMFMLSENGKLIAYR